MAANIPSVGWGLDVAVMKRVYKNIVAQHSSRNHFGDVYINRRTRKELLLESLGFEGMYHPRELEALEGTYEWIFEENATSFPDWARREDGLFWITGKAGSGKSTLMRFIAGHQHTPTLLQEWAGSDRVIIANFFFWSTGNKMQRSQLGLMQSLLYQLVYEADALTLDAVATDRADADESAWKRPWTRKELSRALNLLVRELPRGQRYCLFIDGLDEYELQNPDEGNYDDLVRYIDTLASSPSAKVCVASRPWNVFKDAYTQLGPFQLKMQDFTANDMAKFVKRRLTDDQRFIDMHAQDNDLKDLAEIIQHSAEGVFLWVILAVKQIRWGLREQDDLATLKRRIESLPSELDEFLERIFQSIESVHEVFAGRVLLLTLQAIFPSGREMLEYSYIEHLLTEPNFAVTAPSRPLSAIEIQRRMARTEMLINKWCKDLLEISRIGSKSDSQSRYGYDFPRIAIAFPHRTIAEFAQSKERDGVLSKMAGRNFSPLLLKWDMMLLVLKGSPDNESFRVATQHTLELLEEGFESQGVAYVQQFHDLDCLCACSFPTSTYVHSHWSSALRYHIEPIRPASPAGYSAASLAVCRNLDSFAHHTLDQESSRYTSEQLHYALALALVGPTPHGSSGGHLDFAIVNMMLEGQLTLRLNDLLLSWHSRLYSVWQLFLLRLADHMKAVSKSGLVAHDILALVRLLLDRGADPDGHICVSDMAVDTQRKLPQPTSCRDLRPAREVFAELHRWQVRCNDPGGAVSRYWELKTLLDLASQKKPSGARDDTVSSPKAGHTLSRFRIALNLRTRRR